MLRRDFLETMRSYFRGEVRESYLLLGISVVLLCGSVAVLAGVAAPFARGLAGVLVATAMIGGAVGGTIVLRTERQLSDLARLYAADRERFAAEEGHRMEEVVRSFGIYRFAYGAAVIAALGLAASTRDPWLNGVAVGLLVFAALGLAVDHFAETRAVRYAAEVRAQSAAPPAPSGLDAPARPPSAAIDSLETVRSEPFTGEVFDTLEPDTR